MNTNPNSPPIRPSPAEVVPVQGDATGGVIPYKNPKALVAYYLSIAGLLIPLLGIAALVLGVQGLRARNKNPVIKGSVHAWIGIVLGALSTLAWTGCLGTMLIGFFVARSSAAARASQPAAVQQGTPADEGMPAEDE